KECNVCTIQTPLAINCHISHTHFTLRDSLPLASSLRHRPTEIGTDSYIRTHTHTDTQKYVQIHTHTHTHTHTEREREGPLMTASLNALSLCVCVCGRQGWLALRSVNWTGKQILCHTRRHEY